MLGAPYTIFPSNLRCTSCINTELNSQTYLASGRRWARSESFYRLITETLRGREYYAKCELRGAVPRPGKNVILHSCFAYMHTCIHPSIHPSIHKFLHTHTHYISFMLAYMHAYIRTYIHTYIHTYTHTHIIHTHTHTYITFISDYVVLHAVVVHRC